MLAEIGSRTPVVTFRSNDQRHIAIWEPFYIYDARLKNYEFIKKMERTKRYISSCVFCMLVFIAILFSLGAKTESTFNKYEFMQNEQEREYKEHCLHKILRLME